MTLPKPETAIPAIVPFLTHTNSRVRVEASYAIGRFPPVPEPGHGTVLTLLSDPDGTVRANAARAIGLSGVRSETIFEALEARLDDLNAVTRFRAAEALARLGGLGATNRTARLLAVITEAERSQIDYHRLIAFNAQTALGQAELVSEPMIDAFHDLLLKSMPYFRLEAVESLRLHCETYGTPPPPAIRALLVSAQQDPDGLIRRQAICALREYP